MVPTDLRLRQTLCFKCGHDTLRIIKVLIGTSGKARYNLECMACPGHGEVKMVKRDGEPINTFTLQSWGPSETPPPIGQEFPLR